ncbi:MAG TPA: DNA-directed RNA polymerase [Roseomonas sp.]|nr:DNA-directed RNA polymerase [Roseomonas sp.]
MDEQIKLEEEMLTGGMDRVLKAAQQAEERGEAAASPGARYLMRHLLEPVSKAVTAFLDEAMSGKAGPKHTALPPVAICGDKEAAYIALRTVLNDLTGGDAPKLTAVARNVGRGIELELWMREFKKENRELFKVTMAELDEHSGPQQRHAIARKFARKANVRGEWTPAAQLHVGMKLLDIVREATGLFKLVLVREGKSKTEYVLELSEAASARMKEVCKAAGMVAPSLMPSLVPPKPWSDPFEGGYHSGLFKRLRLVKTWSDAALEELANQDLSRVLTAVNAVQDTPWRINDRVLEVLREALDTERGIAGLPERDPEIPPFPPEAEHNEDAKKAWKRSAAKAHAKKRKNLGKRLQVHKAVSLAERFQGRLIYFPHQMDFRGRLYPLPAVLNPQGPDYVKALLTFGRGYPIVDQKAADWLAISGANHYGVDKCSLLDRVKWTQANEEAIRAVAADPWGPGFDFWTKADKPWQFLAFCFEWAAFRDHGWGFVSSLPVALDGSCNGLQHYSSALRDPVGGAAVNLLPGELPSDIYATVAKLAGELAKEFLRPDGPTNGRIMHLDRLLGFWKERGINPRMMAERWLAFGLDRKLCKRPVMTLPYGSTTFSCREFLEDAAMERIEKGAPNPFYAGNDIVEARRCMFDATLFLQPLVWQAIGETVKAARVGMDWLQACAKVVAGLGLPVSWRTADGFLVQQAYRKWEAHRVKTMIDGHIIMPVVSTVGLDVDKRAQAQGIAPNWVHSQDATALRMFVVLAKERGLTEYALVHDSYGAPAAKVELMAECLKEAFVRLYTDFDPIVEFYLDMLDQLPEGEIDMLPTPPAKGDLDVSLIRKSDYFFA